MKKYIYLIALHNIIALIQIREDRKDEGKYTNKKNITTRKTRKVKLEKREEKDK